MTIKCHIFLSKTTFLSLKIHLLHKIVLLLEYTCFIRLSFLVSIFIIRSFCFVTPNSLRFFVASRFSYFDADICFSFFFFFSTFQTIFTSNHVRFLKYKNACFPVNVRICNKIINTQLELWKRNISWFGYAGPNHGIKNVILILGH